MGVVALADRDAAVPLLDGDRLVPGLDRLGPVLVDGDRLAAALGIAVADGERLVVEDGDGLAAVGGIGGAGPDAERLIIEDLDRLVALVLLVEADLERVVVLDVRG